MSAQLEIRTLGSVTIQRDNQPIQGFVSAKAKGLIIYLACEPRPHPREVLAEMLWPERPPGVARSDLNVVLTNLRKLLFRTYLVTTYDTVSINPDMPYRVDATEFEQHLTQLNDLTVDQLKYALDLYQGEFLSGFYIEDSADFERWASLKRELLHELAVRAFDALIEQYCADHCFDAALTYAYRLLQMDEEREKTFCHLMKLYEWKGERRKATELYASYHSILQPSSEMIDVYNWIVEGTLLKPPRQVPEPQLEPVGQTYNAALIRTINDIPFRARKLIGREDLLAEIHSWLDLGERVVLHGFGGVGKTVLAGEIIAQRLRPNNLPMVWVEAGAEQAETLLIALARPFDRHQPVAAAQGESRLQIVRNLLGDQGVKLVIIDNVWNGPALEQVLRACPLHMPVLVTSRECYSIGKIVKVSDLMPTDALDLLSEHAYQPFVPENKSAVELCQTLGFHL